MRSTRGDRWLAMVVLLAAPALATVVIREDVDELARRSPLIVHGRVERVVSSVDGAGGRIWTDAEVTVREVLAGRAGPVVVVRQPGGEVGTRGQAVAGTARLAPGMEVVLFLEPSAAPGAHVPRGLASGVVYRAEEHGQAVGVRRLDGLGLADVRSRLVVRGPHEERLGSWDALLARVRRVARPAVAPPRPGAGTVTP